MLVDLEKMKISLAEALSSIKKFMIIHDSIIDDFIRPIRCMR